MTVKKVLTIAGSDCSGGAGIQADLKTMTVLGVYGMSVITALTAQNTTGVSDILPVPADFLREQLDAVFDDIFPDAVKIGMTGSAETIGVIADELSEHGASHIVADPVTAATSGASLMERDGEKALLDRLLPMAELATPNMLEAEQLSGIRVRTKEDMEKAAVRIRGLCGCAVLCKGGHLEDCSDDVLAGPDGILWFPGARIRNPNTHGTGCTLSSAIASFLARGQGLEEAVINGKKYIEGALAYGLNLGQGRGPLFHGWDLGRTEKEC
ncbi:MAG: bifunctional hydroxymethylpyrimidine kinase/phosphomethylpyrimidine kinase [Oscillospiraceae bacterium]|nr:bifunctional hydroxymethylpyrimidine kinase/phosphomethylpyrimidine kinase [Oscillospiraceae bacterium]